VHQVESTVITPADGLSPRDEHARTRQPVCPNPSLSFDSSSGVVLTRLPEPAPTRVKSLVEVPNRGKETGGCVNCRTVLLTALNRRRTLASAQATGTPA